MINNIAGRFCLGAGIGILGFIPFDRMTLYLRSDRKPLNFSLVDRETKIHCLFIGILISPIFEEIVYRGALQGVVLQRISQRIFSPLFAKYVQIVAASLLFAYPHHNKECALLLGIELGIIKESKLKLAGSIGAHMANNCLSLKPLFIQEN